MILKPDNIITTTVLNLVIALALNKQLSYYRIFEQFSALVTLVNKVFYQLRMFLVFYLIMIFFFGQVLSLIEF